MKHYLSRPMDQSTVFQQSLFPHIFVNSKSSCFTQNSAISPCKTGKRTWKLTTCWAVGSSRNISDEDSFTKENLNGSLFDALSDESSSPAPFGTLEAEITQETIDFFVSDAEGDPDCPSPGYSSIEQALTALRQEKFVIVVDDDETGNIEGNLVMAASHVSSKAIAFMVKHGSGIVSVGMKGEDLERLKLPLMSPDKEDDSSAPSFTITVDVKVGTSTGVSASDRAKTVRALSSPQSRPEDFRRPGHVFPLKYRNGGVLRRVGHTEASVDLVTLAGLQPVSVLSAVVDTEDVSMASLAELKKLASDHSIPIVLITDLIRYRRKREKLVERTAISRLPTKWGLFHAHCYRSKLDGMEHIAIVKGDIGNGQDVLVRVHSECLTGDIFGSRRCDCGNQLDLAMQLIEQAGRGVVVYLRGHEGRGIGLGHKLQAYNLQDEGHDTVEANLELGFAADAREYGIGAQILHDIGVHTMRLMTNNPAKFTGLKGYGLAVVGRVPVLTPITEDNKRYLETKRIKMGHVYGSDLQEQYTQLTKPSTDKQGSSEGKSTS
ncbi:monofunctional riboflavin biosynthesis protein RIBA 3, chloroplastic [Sesamum indicum]|uniref:GTP cyclohydrolase II n=1 Tax=Sesamum indicum TaxID=4182 RepID=A0A6I9TY68_SESIN|nr:monofunctional riboflavin biosynthesis protein RIBA 3, chloroplastic [Sesamum indicum]